MNSPILEVAIGLSFIYLFFSLVCTAFNEFISQVFSLRARNLEDALKNMLASEPQREALVKALYAHPLIDCLTQNGKKPSYIPSQSFAMAVIDLLAPPNPSAVLSFSSVLDSIQKIEDPQVKTALLALVDHSQNDLEKFKGQVEDWFNATMDRASGWYKKKLQWITLGIAALVVGAMNVDSIYIASRLYNEPQMRANLANYAQLTVGKYGNDSALLQSQNGADQADLQADVKDLKTALEGLSTDARGVPFPIEGWKDAHVELGLVAKFFGLLISALAISLGAPFWFDTLGRFVQLRAAGTKPASKAASPNTQ